MAKDAESHVGEDRKRKEEVETKNQADAMVYNIEKMLKEHREKISEADARQVEQAVADTKNAIHEGGADRIKAAMDKLTTASHKLAEAMYKASSQPGASASDGGAAPPPGEGQPKAGADNVVDAEFVDVDEKKS
jgi:molecular chaperone DnaK